MFIKSLVSFFMVMQCITARRVIQVFHYFYTDMLFSATENILATFLSQNNFSYKQQL